MASYKEASDNLSQNIRRAFRLTLPNLNADAISKSFSQDEQKVLELWNAKMKSRARI